MAGHITKRRYSYGTRWRARHPDPSKGGSSKIERTFATRREAEDWLDEVKHSLRGGTFIDPRAKLTFRRVADEWRATWTDLQPRTRAGYDAILEKHVLPRWGKARVSGITADRIQQWVNEGLSPTREPNTVRNIYAVLRDVLTLAQRRRYIAANPCAAVRLPRKRSGQQHRQDKRMATKRPKKSLRTRPSL